MKGACTDGDVKSLIMSGALEEMGSPFCENSSNLVVLDSRNIAGGGAARLRIHPHSVQWGAHYD